MKAKLIYYQKAHFQGRFILEMSIHDVGQSSRYPDGVKYGLLFLDLGNRRRVLMDNHHPKGHHLHLDDLELPYLYTNDENLIQDFKRFVRDHTGVAI